MLGFRRGPAAAIPRPQALQDRYDVVIVGGGVRALAIARACVGAATSVALFAPDEIAGAADERGWPVVRAVHRDPQRTTAEARSPKRTAKFARGAGAPISRERTGALTLSTSSYDLERLTAAAARANGLRVQAWMVPPLEVGALSPPIAAWTGLSAALYEPRATTLDVDALAVGLAEAASAAGAALFKATPVSALEREGGAVTGVRLGDRLVRAGAVVLADDFAAIRLVREGKGRLSLKREERLILTTDSAAPAIGPALSIDELTLARDVSGALVASGPIGGDTLARRLVEAAPSLAGLSVAAEEPVTVWAGVDGRAQVGAADIPGLWLALGFGRDALSGAFPAARQIGALILERATDPAMEPFAPTRRPALRERDLVR